jgi:hypothetical protein
MRIEGSTLICRPPETVFDFVADERKNYATRSTKRSSSPAGRWVWARGSGAPPPADADPST